MYNMVYESYSNKAAIKKKVKGLSVHQNVVLPVWLCREALSSGAAPRSPDLLSRVELEPVCGTSPADPYLHTSIKITA